MTTIKEVIRILHRDQSAENFFREILEKGGRYRIYQNRPFESAIVDGDVEEVAEYLNSLLIEKREREKEAKRKAIIDKIAVFIDCHSTQATDAKGFVDYVIQKAGIVMDDRNWFAQQNKISVYYEWASHSFFDDGGGEEGYRKWSITFVGNEGNYMLQNKKLNDLSEYRANTKDSFYCRDPFGLIGIYEICFEGERKTTD